MRGFYGQLFGAAFLVIARQQQAYQAHGKGTAPEAGPRHGAVGLWVTPERAARVTKVAALMVQSKRIQLTEYV